MAKYNTEEIINSSYENVKALSERLKDLDEMHKTLKTVVDENTQIPVYFKNIVNEINDSTKVYLEGHKEVLSETIVKFNDELSILEKESANLKAEIERLEGIDLKEHFEKHQGKLSEIFNSINGIQTNITSISQNLLSTIHGISNVELKILNLEVKFINEIENQSKKIKEDNNELIKLYNTLNNKIIQQAELQKKHNYIITILLAIILLVFLFK